ncbi:tetratricopeptide repeat protein [Nocardia sp. 2]|uniref:Tetratricopeptide repeat protein n=1 Tax=Nocardia acididurans TaxID=2802282 RepID=A0ABS1M268_9NOCA|nr:tetratricopeptide repeat protein [Nocardia acididurans]MBL1074763.1 tetratricopeptide repeat protein [Nocardia acididurans]
MSADYFDLGTFARGVTASSPDAQLWFDRGLIWTYAFHHEEAVRCFQQALSADPECAMAYWGLAFALGPNYNKPWEFFDADELATTVLGTHDAVRRGLTLADTATPVERALLEALAARYPRSAPEGDHSGWNRDYAEAMRTAYQRFPDDLDVAALFADALMNLTPWALWDQRTGRPAEGAFTLEAKAVLDRALRTAEGLAHPGILHLHIHLMEMSPTPESALAVADRLRGLVPDAGHLEHMPSHLDVLCGDYRKVVAANSAAIAADAKFVRQGGEINFYTLYRAHNYHFKIYGAMFLGQSATALETIAQLENSIPEELLRVESPPMADWLESFVSLRVHALIRFGRWAEIIALELPKDPELYCVTTAMLHYAKGVAYSATARVAQAEAQRELFRAAVDRVPDSRTLFNNACRDILAIAAAMLDGELLYRKGQYDSAFQALRRSVELDDNLPYDEPWGWMQPTRHALGALLLEQGRVTEAEAVYRADLGLDHTLPRACQHPGNVWSLHGYHECLVRLGKTDAAEIIAQQLKLATALADVPIAASCLCRGVAEPDGESCCH